MYVALVTGNANQLTKFLIPSLIRVGDIERGTKIKCGTADPQMQRTNFYMEPYYS